MYPIGASNHTYNTLPSASGSGTFTPQSKSRVTARGCRPASIQLLHCPSTLAFQSFWCSFNIQLRSQSSCLLSGRYQCLVAFFTGGLPLRVLTGLINSSGLKDVPQVSH